MATTDTVQLCEDVSAEVTLEREHIPATRVTKRKLQNGTYRLYANGSYVLRMRLVPNHRYLFHDGTIDYMRNKGTRIPVALRINDYIGIALSDAAPKKDPNDYTPHPDGMTIPAPGDEPNW